MRTSPRTYDTVSILLHWTVGIGILLLAGTELLRHEFPKGHLIREGLNPSTSRSAPCSSASSCCASCGG